MDDFDLSSDFSKLDDLARFYYCVQLILFTHRLVMKSLEQTLLEKKENEK